MGRQYAHPPAPSTCHGQEGPGPRKQTRAAPAPVASFMIVSGRCPEDGKQAGRMSNVWPVRDHGHADLVQKGFGRSFLFSSPRMCASVAVEKTLPHLLVYRHVTTLSSPRQR